MRQESRMETDRLFHAYLTAEDQSAAAESLERLFRHHLMPQIKSVVTAHLLADTCGRRKSPVTHDVDDITNDVVCRLIRQFRRLRGTPSDEHPRDLLSYMTTVTTNACNDYHRKEHPEHHHLREKVRAAIKRQAGFALWTTADKKLVCGPAGLKGCNGKALSPSDLERTRAAIESLDPTTLASVATQAERVQGLLEVIFECLTAPLALNDIVDLLVRLLPPTGHASYGEKGKTDAIESLDQQQHPGPGPDALLEDRIRIEHLWDETSQLPVDQRRALLLNFRDGQGTNMIALLLRVRGASPAELRDLLAMSKEQFEGIFNRLPLQDAEIAALLGKSRRQVINLRKAARERLQRRRKGGD